MTRRPPRSDYGDALVVFGLTGDLGHDELLPGLVLLHATGRLGVPVVGVGRNAPDDIEQLLRDAVDPELAARTGLTVDQLVADIELDFVEGDATDAATWTEICERLGDVRLPVVYAALPPALLGEVAERVAASRLPDTCRLVLEKPFGEDRTSAVELHERITDQIDTTRLFLVDHFLAKPAVRNLIDVRRSPLLDLALHAQHLESITIEFPESGGLDGRGSFYEGVGGVVPDVVQNHLLQTVACALASPPDAPSNGAAEREARVDLLRRIAPIDPSRTVLGQYEGYRELDDVDDDSRVPTFVSAELVVDDDRWRDVPVRLRTGKRVADGAFAVDWRLRGDGFARSVRAQIKPHASVQIDLPELDPHTHGTVTATACTPVRADHGALDAYATVLGDALTGERHHMTSIDEVVEAWRIVEPILGPTDDLRTYAPGTPLHDIT